MANWTASASLSILSLVIGISDWAVLPGIYANLGLIVFLLLMSYNAWLTRYLIHNGNPKEIPNSIGTIEMVCFLIGAFVIFVLPFL